MLFSYGMKFSLKQLYHKQTIMLRKIFKLLLVALLTSSAGYSQQVVNLYHEIAQADSLMFHAFNTCDSVTYRKFITEDLEFYHDLGGLTVGADNEIKSFKEMCARNSHIRRELIKSSLEVYPLKGYGAVEIGVHRFYHTNKGQEEKISGTYKFVEVWQFKDKQWKISRVISYGHNEMHNN